MSLLLALLLAAAADDVRAAETGFARAFAERDVARFMSFVADDARFLGARKTFSGKDEIRKGWHDLLTSPKPPFSWKPDRVLANDKGDLAISSGPVFDGSGKQTGSFVSTWQKQADGSWKIIFDSPGPQVCSGGQ